MAAFRAVLVALQSFPLLNQPAYNSIRDFQCLVNMRARNRYFELMLRIGISRISCGMRINALCILNIWPEDAWGLVRGLVLHPLLNPRLS